MFYHFPLETSSGSNVGHRRETPELNLQLSHDAHVTPTLPPPLHPRLILPHRVVAKDKNGITTFTHGPEHHPGGYEREKEKAVWGRNDLSIM